MILAQLTSDDVLDTAYDWLCKRRIDYPPNADIWAFRRRWPREKDRLRADLVAGQYRFSLLARNTLANGEEVDLWSARDALVLKALALVLGEHLPISPRCTHVKGHGGAKAAVRKVRDRLAENHFVLRTDVKSYYASIDHFLLLDQLAVYIKDRRVLNLIGQYLRRCAERGGVFWEHAKGISLGSPLSPLMGAFFLKRLDERMETLGLFYVRFMDDILVLAPTRWRLRKAVMVLNQVLGVLRLEKHPDKTFIGRIERGFDFLGYHFSPAGLTVAKETAARFVARAIQLYEQEPGKPVGSSRLGVYVERWIRWVRGGMLENPAFKGQPGGRRTRAEYHPGTCCGTLGYTETAEGRHRCHGPFSLSCRRAGGGDRPPRRGRTGGAASGGPPGRGPSRSSPRVLRGKRVGGFII